LISEHKGGQVIAQYEYGYLDKVTQVTRNGEVTEFHYNARGMLVAKERDGQIVETFGWDGIGLIAKDDTVYANEAHISGGVPLAAIDAGSESAEMQYFDSDYLGTTTAVYSAEGAVDSKLAASFGAGTESDELRFTGKPYDADLDAHVFPYRNYKSEAGRWASADPAGFPDGPNQHYYACVPTMGLDPLGLYSQTRSGSFNIVGIQEITWNYEMIYDRNGRRLPDDPVKHEPELDITGFNATGNNHSQTFGVTVTLGGQSYGVGSAASLTFGQPSKTDYEYFDLGDDVFQLVEDWEVAVILSITETEGVGTTTSPVNIGTMSFALVDVGEF
jgi:RHS repeat-associated protein